MAGVRSFSIINYQLSIMFGMFDNPKKPKPIPPPAADNTQVQEAAAEARKRAAAMKGRASTEVASRLGNVGATA